MKLLFCSILLVLSFPSFSYGCEGSRCTDLPIIELPLETNVKDSEIASKTKIPVKELVKL